MAEQQLLVQDGAKTEEQPSQPHALKSLREKAINIKGKSYVLVSDRVLYFNEAFPEGSIVTEILSTIEAETVVIKATVSPDQKRFFVGHSQAKWGDGYINKTSALENAETSAVGRALAFMGIGVLESIASADEIAKAQQLEQHEKAFGERVAEEPVAESLFNAAYKTWASQGKTGEQIEQYCQVNFKKAPRQVNRAQLDQVFKWAAGKEELQKTLDSSAQAAADRAVVPKSQVRTQISGLVGEEGMAEVKGVLSGVEKAFKGGKTWLSLTMMDAVKLSDWDLDREITYKSMIGKDITLLAKVKQSGKNVYYNVDSIEVQA